MAQPVAPSKPARALLVMLLITVVMVLWAAWPGTPNTPQLGLDLRGGTQVILTPKSVTEGEEITDTQLNQTVEIIRQRVNGIGVAEADISVQGSGNSAAIIVAAPGVSQERLVELVGRTALLDFRPVYAIASPVPVGDDTASDVTPVNGDDTEASSITTGNEIIQATDNTPEFTAQVAALDCLKPENIAGGTPDNPQEWLGTCADDGSAKYTLQPAFIRGTNVTEATAVLPQQGVGGWVVSLTFDAEGASALADVSQELTLLPECSPGGPSPCNAFAIVLDGVVVSSPRFNQAIIGGQAQIEGNFTAQSAQDLANVLNYGALPVTLEVAEITSVSPTLGSDQLRGGIIAGLIGLAIIIVYLMGYYRALGVVAVLSLLLAGVLTYAAFVALGNTIGFTLTLAGIAGAIVAIGITADSFIVYFERIRDEIRNGRSLRQAAESGWVRARRTILAADFVTLLAAIVLYVVSVGNVRGFAFALGLTTIVDVLIAFLFTRPMVAVFARSRWMQRGSWLTGLDASRFGAEEIDLAPTKARTRVPAQVGEES
ncbi:MAG: protein translocase subunit SecD [Candidatus Nanopelagicales bacterium]